MITAAPSLTKADIRLLIVDDEPNIRSALGRALTLLGYTVEEASTGAEALQILQEAFYDLMVLDMRMPGMDGIEVMAQARRLFPELLIIILTGHATLESAIAAIKSEVVDYLQKPASVQDIATAVTQSLEKQNGQRQRRRLVEMMGQALEALRYSERPVPSIHLPEATDVLLLPPLKLDRHKRQLSITSEPIQTLQLTEGETIVLASLMMCPDQILSCRDLIQVGWGYSVTERDAQNIIRPHICRLRRKINGVISPAPRVYTIRKRGYILQTN